MYRWNRPCYGISDNGKPHLRIENRVLPSGPTVVDEMANTAFWIGVMVGLDDAIDDVRKLISWEDVRDNFVKAAQFGIDTKFTWFNDEKITAVDLICKKLIPIARKGLKKRKVDSKDTKRYLDIIEARAKAHMNGARWQLRAYTKLIKETNRDEAVTCLTATMAKNQLENKPIHTWEMPNLTDLKEYRPTSIKVEEFMTTDIFTVQKDDLIELVAEVMDWRELRYIPVENTKGKLTGLVSRRLILRHLIKDDKLTGKTAVVDDIMVKKPITISPDVNILEAMQLMRDKQIGCLPVVTNGELIGVITEMDFVRISSRILERMKV